MIPGFLENITARTLDHLIANPVREKRTIDYKIDTYGDQYAQHREFLADVSSFANSMGGDLVIGVAERGGMPVSVPGMAIANMDKEIQRLQQMVLHGIEPRLTIEPHPISLNNGNTVLIIRVARSWNAPHRVILKGHDKFYARDSSGKHPMNVDELREAFTLAERVEQRIRGFRTQRFAAIKGNKTFEPLSDAGVLILHLIPLSAATSRNALQMVQMQSTTHLLLPIGAGGNSRINLDGIILSSPHLGSGGSEQSSDGYTQLFRNGTIEAVMVLSNKQGERIIPMTFCEESTIKALGLYLRAMRELQVSPPAYLFVGLANVRTHRFLTSSHLFREGTLALDRDDIEVGEVVIERFSEEPTKILHPAFDQIWQAFGFPHSYTLAQMEVPH